MQRSRLHRYSSGSFAYKFRGTLTAGDKELHLLRVRLELLSASGQVLVQKHDEMYADYRPGLRPGESAPADLLVFEKRAAPPIATARLVVEMVEQMPACQSLRQGPGGRVALAGGSGRRILICWWVSARARSRICSASARTG